MEDYSGDRVSSVGIGSRFGVVPYLCVQKSLTSSFDPLSEYAEAQEYAGKCEQVREPLD